MADEEPGGEQETYRWIHVSDTLHPMQSLVVDRGYVGEQSYYRRDGSIDPQRATDAHQFVHHEKMKPNLKNMEGTRMVFKQILECPLDHVIHETTVQINDRVRDRTHPPENSGVICQQTMIHCSPSTDDCSQSQNKKSEKQKP